MPLFVNEAMVDGLANGVIFLKDNIVGFISALAGGSFTIVTILQFRTRKRQLKNIRLLHIWTFLILVYAMVSPNLLGLDYIKEIHKLYAIGLIVPLFIWLFLWLASRSIRNDEALVQSTNRLR